MWTPTVSNCDKYLDSRTGNYDQRAVRYRKAANWLLSCGLTSSHTVIDIGAGFTEFDYCLRREFDFRGRYIPIDGGIDNTDLETWNPIREADFFVGLEILEHLYSWRRLVVSMQKSCLKGICISTPNPCTTDVLGMDSTHVAEIGIPDLEALHFRVEQETFYGGVFSQGKPDSIFATWLR